VQETVLPGARRRVDGTAQKILRHVERNRPQGRGWAIYGAPDLWREYILPVPLPNRAVYGRPDLAPLLWTIEEYEPYAILTVDREHARILLAYLGRTATLEEEALELDTREWRFKAGRQPTFAGRVAGTGRGAQRDSFDARVEDHVRRFWARVAEATGRTLRDLRVEQLIIGGPEEAAKAVADLLPEAARRKVVGLVPLPAHADRREIQHRTLPVALAAEHRRAGELVATLLDRVGARGGAVLGAAATLEALRHRRAHTVVADRACDRTLLQTIPLLARRSGARIALVGEPAAAPLRDHDGIGAILRRPE